MIGYYVRCIIKISIQYHSLSVFADMNKLNCEGTHSLDIINWKTLQNNDLFAFSFLH